MFSVIFKHLCAKRTKGTMTTITKINTQNGKGRQVVVHIMYAVILTFTSVSVLNPVRWLSRVQVRVQSDNTIPINLKISYKFTHGSFFSNLILSMLAMIHTYIVDATNHVKLRVVVLLYRNVQRIMSAFKWCLRFSKNCISGG